MKARHCRAFFSPSPDELVLLYQNFFGEIKIDRSTQ